MTKPRGRPAKIPGVNIRQDYPAFTIRLPVPLYAKLRDEAARERRSMAAQIEIIIEEHYKK